MHGLVAFAKIDVEAQKEIAAANRVTSIPTFLFWRRGQPEPERVRGGDPRHLEEVIKSIATDIQNAEEQGAAGPSSGGEFWTGAVLPKGYSDVTDKIDAKGCEALNADTDYGMVQVLLEKSKPSALQDKKGVTDWVESDTDEQLLIFLPFQSMIRLHTLQV